MKKKILLLSAVLLFGLAACSCDEPKPTISVTNVTLTPTTLDLVVGETATLTATITPSNATNQQKTWSSNNPTIADVTNGEVTTYAPGTATITVITADGNFTETATITVFTREQVTDTGVIIDGIRWATRNVDTPGTFAANPEDAGMLFQWNRKQGWAATGDVTGWNNTPAEGTEWTRANDPCPQGWRVPTDVEIRALINAGFSDMTQLDGVNGRFFGTAPNRIFLPAVGWRSESEEAIGVLIGAGFLGGYWTTGLAGNYASMFFFDGCCSVGVSMRWRQDGLSVRCVAE